MLGGIEFGGTKTVCVVGERGGVTDEIRFPTGDDPAANLERCVAFFAGAGDVTAVGVGAFGPCDPDPRSPGYGTITTTPKPGWAGCDVLGVLGQGLPGAVLAFDTDVNVAALGELVHGAGRGLQSLLYLTIGTGIGGGLVCEGQLVHGMMHPEMGHIRIARPPGEVAAFGGVCPYHGDCFEGVAAGPALAARWGDPAQDITPADDRHGAMWDLEAAYLAAALHNYVCTVSPQRIVVGGGVGENPDLLVRTRPLLHESLAGYVDQPALRSPDYVVTPALGNRSGAIGALELAYRAVVEQSLPRQQTPGAAARQADAL